MSLNAITDGVRELLSPEQWRVVRNVAAILGAGILLKWMLKHVWQLLDGFCAFFLAPWGISRINLKKYGPWAVVTGASEGIGRGYALELARRGLNVVIMSRSQDKLQKVADEIKEKYGREVCIIAVDFSDGQEIYPRIAEELQDLDIGILGESHFALGVTLVNNVGYGVEPPDYFAETPEERHYKIVQVNCHPVVQMTHMLLPKMVEKGHGVVINISSIAADRPYQLISTYSATKKFDSHFSDILRKEYSSKGIIVQDVKPCLVATALSGIRRSSRLVPDPVTYARAAVATIGIQHTTHGYFYHALQANIFGLVPDWLFDFITWMILPAFKERYLKKKAKQS